MKNIFFTIVALFSVLSASAQFSLTAEGLVSSGGESKDYAVVDIPGKTQQEIFEAVETYARSAFGYNGCQVEAVRYDMISVSVGYSFPNDNTIVLKGTDYDMRYNANMMSYKIVFRIKDGKLRMDAPRINRFTVVIRGVAYSALIKQYPMVGRKNALFNRRGKMIKNKAQVVHGIERYFNEMVQEPVRKLTEQW